MAERKTPRKPKKANASKGKSSGLNFQSLMQGVSFLLIGLLKLVVMLLVLCWRGLCAITPPKEWWLAQVRKPAFRRCTAGVLILLLTGWGVASMRQSLAQQDRFTLDPSRIELNQGALSWVTGEAGETVRSLVLSSLRESLSQLPPTDAFDPELPGTVARQLAANPWVARVARVERRFPDNGQPASLDVVVDIRRPLIRVALDSRLWLVDREGVVLPWAPALKHGIPETTADRTISAAITPTVRAVTGIYQPATPTPSLMPTVGKRWDNEQVKAAVSMEETIRLRSVEAWFPVDRIDVFDVAQRASWNGQVDYKADGGVVIHGRLANAPVLWGKAPVHASSVETPIERKLSQLKQELGADATLARWAATPGKRLPLNR